MHFMPIKPNDDSIEFGKMGDSCECEHSLTSMPKCPWFGEPCLRDDCTAFELRSRRSMAYNCTECQNGNIEVVLPHMCFSEGAYCKALKMWLPERKSDQKRSDT
jgi:hypothetical protein